MRIDNAMQFRKPTQGTQFVLYIAQHTDAETKIFSRTYNQIEKDTGISQPVIAKLLKALEDAGTIFRVGKGKWHVPAVVGYSETSDGPEWYVENKLRNTKTNA